MSSSENVWFWGTTPADINVVRLSTADLLVLSGALSNESYRSLSLAGNQVRRACCPGLPAQKFFESARVEETERSAFNLVDLHAVESRF